MIHALAAYTSGILLSNGCVSFYTLQMFLAAVAIYIEIRGICDFKVMVCLAMLATGMIYPQLRMAHVMRTPYCQGSEISGEFKVVKVDKDCFVISSKNRKYIVFEKNELLPGDMIVIEGTFGGFKASMNPFTFRMDRYYHRKGISGIIYLKACSKKGVSKKLSDRIMRLSYETKLSILKVFEKKFEGDALGLLQGMLTGYREALSDTALEDFRKAGMTHIMAVSGAHVAFVLLPFKFIIFRTVKRKRNRIILLFFPAVMYLFITGLGASVLRATIMVLLFSLCDFSGRRSLSRDILACTALIMLLVSPFYIYDASFLLSFSAASGIAVIEGRLSGAPLLSKMPSFFKRLISVSISAQIFAVPAAALIFNKISAVSLITNIVLAPLAQIGTMMAMFVLVPVVSAIAAPLAEASARLLLAGAQKAGALPFSQLAIPGLPLTAVLAYYLTAAELFLSEKKNHVYINILLFIMCFSLLLPAVIKKPEINILAAGNGDSILIITEDDKRILIDGGDNRISFGRYTLVPYLIKKGITYIDIAVVTHSHADHIDGIREVLACIRTGTLLLPDVSDKTAYLEVIKDAERSSTEVYHIGEGDSIAISRKMTLDVLNPEPMSVYSNPNNESVIFMMRYQGYRFLFMGDAEGETEERIRGYLDPVDILKAGHHGSAASSTDCLLEAARPRVSIVSAGQNLYGHPSDLVLERLGSYGRVYVTKNDGHLKFTIINDIIYLEKYVR